MFKKILFAVLLAILAVLSFALYNQYTMLPGRTVADLEDVQKDTGTLERTWAPPASPQPAPPSPESKVKDLALWQEGKGEAPLNQEQSPAEDDQPAPVPQEQQPPAPEQQPQPPAQSQQPQPPAQSQQSQQPQPSQPAAAPPQPDSEESIDSKLGHSELTEGAPEPKKQETDPAPEATSPVDDSASKAEKALRRGKSWLEEQATDLEQDISAGKDELEQEQEVVNNMRLSPSEEQDPDAEVAKLERQLEQRGLGEEQAPAPDPQPQPEATQTATPEQSKPDAVAAGHNQLESLQLSSDGEAVMLRISTAKPIAKYTDFQMHKPKRFVIDLNGHFTRNVQRVNVLPNAMVKDLRIGLHTRMLRIVADLHEDVNVEASVENLSPNELLVTMRHKQ